MLAYLALMLYNVDSGRSVDVIVGEMMIEPSAKAHQQEVWHRHGPSDAPDKLLAAVRRHVLHNRRQVDQDRQAVAVHVLVSSGLPVEAEQGQQDAVCKVDEAVA